MRQWSVLLVLGVGAWSLGACVAQADSGPSASLDPLLDAIAVLESENGAHPIGDGGRALGPYQIHRRYWQDATKILGVDWSYDQAYDAAKARAVVRAYLLYYGKGKSLIQLARIHNGGPGGDRKASTLRYAAKIRKILAAQAQGAQV